MVCRGLSKGGDQRGWRNTDPAPNQRRAGDERVSTGIHPGPLPESWSLPTVPAPLKRGQGQKWEMTGGKSTKVQLTTGGKAVSSNRRSGSQADLRLTLDQYSNSIKPTAVIAQWGPCVPSHPVDASLAVQKFQAAAVSPHIGACLHSFPSLTEERLFFLFFFFRQLRRCPQTESPAAVCSSSSP